MFCPGIGNFGVCETERTVCRGRVGPYISYDTDDTAVPFSSTVLCWTRGGHT